MKKIAIIFGGKSGEHEVSLVSASSIVKVINERSFEVIQIGITESGRWYTGENCLDKFKSKNLEGLTEIFISTDPERIGFIPENGGFIAVDVCFPVLHGPFGEDGTIQGLFEMMNVPYVGCGVLASSTAMDKLQCKAIWEAAGLPVVPYIGLGRSAWEKDSELVLREVKEKLKLPLFVKPANMGSSVGITKVKEWNDLKAAINEAANYDNRILIENGLNVREIECAILGNDDLVASPLGEIIVGGEFYDFNDKYVNGVSRSQIPAEISDDLSKRIKEMSIKAYRLLNCSGLSRVDSFIDKDTGDIFLNEINTLPGFTSISMYPKMMEAYGMSYHSLIERLIELAFERYEDRKKNRVNFNSGSDWFV
ncbi:D-alanine--D-alanine ligase A [Candidatus Peregrinibacteria bacterium CG10_big_fil_rev_8_21_14_0_10_36_19]|nr:MAG: D-alanine--D-alanine ligase A [Candidatus Peregrinibacteria bacterium CG10_big_fil_rev_8_21_14_0_10_36_19]